MGMKLKQVYRVFYLVVPKDRPVFSHNNGKLSPIDCFNDMAHSKNKTPDLGNATHVIGVKLKRGWYVLDYFAK